MLAILAPGQGAQRRGLLAPWLELDGVADELAALSAAAGIDLIAAGTTMSDEEITDTALAQPLIVAAALVTGRLLPHLPTSTVFAGHSVGEFAAVALAGAMQDADAMRLIATRGAAMARASAEPAGGMTALLGGDRTEVLSAIDAAGCVVANHNSNGQIVAAGTREALDRLAAAPPARARVRPLAVAGAFHSELMRPAQEEIAAAATDVSTGTARFGVLSNADGGLLTDGSEILERLVAQVCRPVRWDRCMATMAALGVTATIELAPAGTLTALVRRELPSVTTLALNGPDDLAAARALIDEHGTELADSPLPWQLVVAPAKGTVRVPQGSPRTAVAAGDVVVHVATRTDEVAVRVERSGHLVEWLVSDGDPVSAGQPLARVVAGVSS